MTDTVGTLILVRHGQSQWNLENRFTGWKDIDLSESFDGTVDHTLDVPDITGISCNSQ